MQSYFCANYERFLFSTVVRQTYSNWRPAVWAVWEKLWLRYKLIWCSLLLYQSCHFRFCLSIDWSLRATTRTFRSSFSTASTVFKHINNYFWTFNECNCFVNTCSKASRATIPRLKTVKSRRLPIYSEINRFYHFRGKQPTSVFKTASARYHTEPVSVYLYGFGAFYTSWLYVPDNWLRFYFINIWQ